MVLIGVLVWAWRLFLWMPGRRSRNTTLVLDAQAAELCLTLRRDLSTLATDIGERNVSQRYEQLQQTVRFIEQQLAAVGYEVRRQEFATGDKTVCNLDVERTGVLHPDEIIVVGAHYDTVPGSPGANDNGSAVVANLALARAFGDVDTSRTVRFAFFVNEEFPYHMTPEMGSLQYARACQSRQENIVGMMSLETIGYYTNEPGSQRYPLRPLRWLYPTTGNFVAFIGNVRSRRWIHQVIRGFRCTGFPSEGMAAPEWLRDIFRSDHAAFWDCGYAALMVTDTANFRYPHYHRSSDTPDKINDQALALVVAGLELSLREVAGTGPDAGSLPADDAD
jgi:hypothetical protein